MSLESLTEKLLQGVSRRARTPMRIKLEEYGEYGMLRGTSTVYGTFDVLADELEAELKKMLDELARTGQSRRKLKPLKEKIRSFVINEFEQHKEYLQEIRVMESSQINLEGYIQKRMGEVESALELKILIIEKSIIDRRVKVSWDIGKILITAIIGGVIGAYIRNLIITQAP